MIAGRTATRGMHGVIVEPRRPAATSQPGKEDSADGPTRALRRSDRCPQEWPASQPGLDVGGG